MGLLRKDELLPITSHLVSYCISEIRGTGIVYILHVWLALPRPIYLYMIRNESKERVEGVQLVTNERNIFSSTSLRNSPCLRAGFSRSFSTFRCRIIYGLFRDGLER